MGFFPCSAAVPRLPLCWGNATATCPYLAARSLSSHESTQMSTTIESPSLAYPTPHRGSDSSAASLTRDFGQALRAAMRAHVEALGGVPMMYQVGALSVQPQGSRIRVDGAPGSCTVTALFPGIQVRAFANTPGGWFAQVPTHGYRAEGSAVVCSPGTPAPRDSFPEWLGAAPPVLL